MDNNKIIIVLLVVIIGILLLLIGTTIFPINEQERLQLRDNQPRFT